MIQKIMLKMCVTSVQWTDWVETFNGIQQFDAWMEILALNHLEDVLSCFYLFKLFLTISTFVDALVSAFLTVYHIFSCQIYWY